MTSSFTLLPFLVALACISVLVYGQDSFTYLAPLKTFVCNAYDPNTKEVFAKSTSCVTFNKRFVNGTEVFKTGCVPQTCERFEKHLRHQLKKSMINQVNYTCCNTLSCNGYEDGWQLSKKTGFKPVRLNQILDEKRRVQLFRKRIV